MTVRPGGDHAQADLEKETRTPTSGSLKTRRNRRSCRSIFQSSKKAPIPLKKRWKSAYGKVVRELGMTAPPYRGRTVSPLMKHAVVERSTRRQGGALPG